MQEMLINFAFSGPSWLHSSDVFPIQFFSDDELRKHSDFVRGGVPGTKIYTSIYNGRETDDKSNINPQLIIPVGIPNSGKSTWIREFLSKSDLDWQVISLDAIHEQYARESGIGYRDTFTPEKMNLLRGRYYSVIEDAMKMGKNIIIDETNVSKEERKAILEMADSSGNVYYKQAFVFPVRPRVSKLRDIERDNRRIADGDIPRAIPESYITETHFKFEKPELVEGFQDVCWMGHHRALSNLSGSSCSRYR